MIMADKRKAPVSLRRKQSFPFLGTKNTRTDFKQKNVVIGAKAQESIGMTGIH